MRNTNKQSPKKPTKRKSTSSFRSNPYKEGALILSVILIIATPLVWLTVWSASGLIQDLKVNQPTEAIVTSYRYNSASLSRQTGSDHFQVDFTYNVRGKNYSGSGTIDATKANYQSDLSGMKVALKYEADNPTNYRLSSNSGRVWSHAAIFGLLVFGLIGGLLYLFARQAYNYYMLLLIPLLLLSLIGVLAYKLLRFFN